MSNNTTLFLALLLISIALLSRANAQPGEAGVSLLTGALTGTSLGAADAWDNTWRWDNIRHGPGSPEATHSNSMRHRWAGVARASVVASIGAHGLSFEKPVEQTALYGITLATSHHIAHNIQQGQPLSYSLFTHATDRPHSHSRRNAAILSTMIGTVGGLTYAVAVEDPRVGTAIQVAGVTTTASSVVMYATGDNGPADVFIGTALGLSIAGIGTIINEL